MSHETSPCQAPPSQETIMQPSGIHNESVPELPLVNVVVKKIDPVESAKVKLLPFQPSPNESYILIV